MIAMPTCAKPFHFLFEGSDGETDAFGGEGLACVARKRSLVPGQCRYRTLEGEGRTSVPCRSVFGSWPAIRATDHGVITMRNVGLKVLIRVRPSDYQVCRR